MIIKFFLFLLVTLTKEQSSSLFDHTLSMEVLPATVVPRFSRSTITWRLTVHRPSDRSKSCPCKFRWKLLKSLDNRVMEVVANENLWFTSRDVSCPMTSTLVIGAIDDWSTGKYTCHVTCFYNDVKVISSSDHATLTLKEEHEGQINKKNTLILVGLLIFLGLAIVLGVTIKILCIRKEPIRRNFSQ